MADTTNTLTIKTTDGKTWTLSVTTGSERTQALAIYQSRGDITFTESGVVYHYSKYQILSVSYTPAS